MSHRDVPQGRLSRIARMAAMGARIGATKLLDHHESAAAASAEVLGTLRGLAAKVGQMAGYVDGVVPEAQREAYEKAMAGLRAAAPSSNPEQIRRLVEEELGSPMEELFLEWNDVPFASASIGQVHRARLNDGSEVAVKVQHPGIARAVESDLANAVFLETMVGHFMGKQFNTRGMFEEAKIRFREELDYELEARRQTHFARLFADDPTVRVPHVVESHTTKRVLTAELVHGVGLEEAMQATSQERKAWAETLWRFVFRGNLVGGMFNADPHPGNYLFLPEGRVNFLDFGCVQPLFPAQQAHAIVLHSAAIAHDEGRFMDEGVQYLQTKPGRHEKMALAFLRRCFNPLFQSPWLMTRDYVASLVQELRDSAMEARKLAPEDMAPLPAGTLFMNRLQFGFYSVLARLDVEVDYAAVEGAFIDEARARSDFGGGWGAGTPNPRQ